MIKVAIDPGHGGRASGAVYGDLKEKDLNYELALVLDEILSPKYDTRFMRENDWNVGNTTRARWANNFKADVYISLHHNAGGGEGIEVLHFPSSSVGRKLAMSLATKFGLKLSLRNRGAKSGWYRGIVGKYITVLRKTKMPAILIEACFLDNERDRVWLDETTRPVFYRSIAECIKEVLDEAFTV